MLVLVKFIYITFLLPPGLFIAALALLCVRLYHEKSSALKGVAIITAFLYLVSIPLIGDFFIRSLENCHYPPEKVSGDVIVMLGGGATADTPNVHGRGHLSGSAANRLLTAVQLYRLLDVPIVVSGGQVFANTGKEAEIAKHILLGLGVPENKIIVEGQSLNTTDNAKFTKTILEQYGFTRPVLVTSAFHMERSVRQFAKFNILVTPYPTDYQTNSSFIFEGYQLWPSAGALATTQLALKEYLGLLAVGWY